MVFLVSPNGDGPFWAFLLVRLGPDLPVDERHQEGQRRQTSDGR